MVSGVGVPKNNCAQLLYGYHRVLGAAVLGLMVLLFAGFQIHEYSSTNKLLQFPSASATAFPDHTPFINVLTRTKGNRSRYTPEKQGVREQETRVRHLVSSENLTFTYKDGDVLYVPHYEHDVNNPQNGRGHSKTCPYNKHLNTLARNVTKGWVLFLDDDASMFSPTFATRLSRFLSTFNRDTVVFFEIKYGQPPARTLPSNYHTVAFKHIDMANFVVHHSVLNNFQFTSACGGDFLFLKHLRNVGMKAAWLDTEPGLHANYRGHNFGNG